MKTRAVFIAFIIGFVLLCGGLVAVDSGIFGGALKAAQVDAIQDQSPAGSPPNEQSTATMQPDKSDLLQLRATQAGLETRSLGALYPEVKRTEDADRYKFKIDLTSRGASISRATLSEFDNRDPSDPGALALLSAPNNAEIGVQALANGYFGIAGTGSRIPLHSLNWEIADEAETNGQQSVTFRATLRDGKGADAIRLTKTFRVAPNSYDVECELRTENLTGEPIEATLEIQGPSGINREGIGSDMRKAVAAYKVNSHVESVSRDYSALRNALQRGNTDKLRLMHKNPEARFVWGAVTNKYFAAILRPVPEEGASVEGIVPNPVEYFEPQSTGRRPDEHAWARMDLRVTNLKLSPAGQDGAVTTSRFDLYLGPKDRDVFERNPVYRQLAYFQTIDFRGCCCPTSIIAPLAFGIITIMKWIYAAMGPLGNYGVVIIILVLVVRLILHPITKKSQVSMMKMQKLAPKMEEIKKKYANNKAELNKQMMGLYREQGASPVMGFLPMLLQMPIWIALWTAVYISIELRGAPFLPFWITDLSAPDALVRFPQVTIPLVDWSISSFNLLPLLMGFVMYLQQKLMPTSSAAQANPQVAQQQKIMMIMMPLMFPIMLYNGPSGVNLYIMSSIAGGVVEQMVIRKHIREREEEEARGLVPVTKKTGGKVKKKKPKPFFKS